MTKMTLSNLSLLPVIGLLLFQSTLFQSAYGVELPTVNTEAVQNPEISLEDVEDVETGQFLTKVANDSAKNELIRRALIDKKLHEEAIVELEINQGAYSSELSEVYLDLGYVLRTLEQHEEAALAFNKAIQSIRISNGLNDLQQLPILQELLVSNQNQENWKAVDANIHLIFHITRQNFDAGNDRRIQAVEQLGRWKLKAAREELLAGYFNSARESAALYKNEIRNLEDLESYNGKNIHLATMYLGLATGQFSLASRALDRPLSDYQTGTQRTTMKSECFLVRGPNGKLTQVCRTVEVPNINFFIEPTNRKNQEIKNHLSSMKKSIVQAFDLLQNESQLSVQRDLLLGEVRQLTNDYNGFMTEHSL